ncbi:MAG TPA: NADP-dependent oxidoreductase [Polyangiaceae bacterium]|nr:NADP-dependent oxidoreductase [Polyangiaceae bacterium]
MAQTYQRIVLASRPTGAVKPENFRLETVPLPEPGEGQVLVRNQYLSLDPYMRGRMNEVKSYAAPQPLDEVMLGGTAGEVVASKSPKFAAGDRVVGALGWQEYALSDGAGLTKVDTSRVPLSAYLGVVGMPGMTAWYGVNKILAPKAGETVVVSAAAGAVGSAVGQLAKLAGARAVGVAGGADKCAHVVRDLGFDACIDYKAAHGVEGLVALLKDAAPDGIDAYFDNVGGDVLNAVLARLNPFARVAICGLISGYNGEQTPITNPAALLVKRVKLQGFIISDHLELWPQGLAELGALVAADKLRYRETVAEGLASAPEAFIGLLQGKNLGKQIVKLA